MLEPRVYDYSRGPVHGLDTYGHVQRAFANCFDDARVDYQHDAVDGAKRYLRQRVGHRNGLANLEVDYIQPVQISDVSRRCRPGSTSG